MPDNLLDSMAAKNRVDLARQIQLIIQNFTFARPMPPDEIIGVMAFCVGSAVGNQPDGPDKRGLIELAMKFFADGQAVAEKKRPASASILMPDSLN